MWLYSGTVVVIGQKLFYARKSGCIRAKFVFGQSGCFWANVFAIGLSGCIRTKWLHSGKGDCIRED